MGLENSSNENDEKEKKKSLLLTNLSYNYYPRRYELHM